MSRQLPEQSERVETGPVKFGDDWYGVFLRGDCASFYATVIEKCLRDRGDDFSFSLLRSLHSLLVQSVEGPAQSLFEKELGTGNQVSKDVE